MADYDHLLAALRNEFADEAEDNLNEIDVVLGNINSGQEDAKEAIVKIQRPAHSLKGSAGVAEFPLVAIIMHRLEDYLSGLDTLDKEHVEDIQKFVELGREYSSVDIDQQSVSSSDLVRELPAKHISGVDESAIVPQRIIEAMMVIKEKTAGLLFERELRAAGLRVNTVRSSFEAFELAVRTRPDLIVVSGVLDILNGVDVSSALKAMPKTKDLPVCILTSSEPDNLPQDVAVIHKNNLKEDLNNALNKFGLLA